MVLCNLSVTRIVYRSNRNMQQLTLSCLENADRPIKLRHQISAVSSASSRSISLITQDEIRFISMCNLLTASFVVCWGSQMVSQNRKSLRRHNSRDLHFHVLRRVNEKCSFAQTVCSFYSDRFRDSDVNGTKLIWITKAQISILWTLRKKNISNWEPLCKSHSINFNFK